MSTSPMKAAVPSPKLNKVEEKKEKKEVLKNEKASLAFICGFYLYAKG